MVMWRRSPAEGWRLPPVEKYNYLILNNYLIILVSAIRRMNRTEVDAGALDTRVNCAEHHVTLWGSITKTPMALHLNIIQDFQCR
jgi:hypothetical protein